MAPPTSGSSAADATAPDGAGGATQGTAAPTMTTISPATAPSSLTALPAAAPAAPVAPAALPVPASTVGSVSPLGTATSTAPLKPWFVWNRACRSALCYLMDGHAHWVECENTFRCVITSWACGGTLHGFTSMVSFVCDDSCWSCCRLALTAAQAKQMPPDSTARLKPRSQASALYKQVRQPCMQLFALLLGVCTPSSDSALSFVLARFRYSTGSQLVAMWPRGAVSEKTLRTITNTERQRKRKLAKRTGSAAGDGSGSKAGSVFSASSMGRSSALARPAAPATDAATPTAATSAPANATATAPSPAMSPNPSPAPGPNPTNSTAAVSAPATPTPSATPTRPVKRKAPSGSGAGAAASGGSGRVKKPRRRAPRFEFEAVKGVEFDDRRFTESDFINKTGLAASQEDEPPTPVSQDATTPATPS